MVAYRAWELMRGGVGGLRLSNLLLGEVALSQRTQSGVHNHHALVTKYPWGNLGAHLRRMQRDPA